MNGITAELLFAVLVIAVLTARYLMNRRRARRAPGHASPHENARAPDEAFPGAADLERLLATVPLPPRPSFDQPPFKQAPVAVDARRRRRRPVSQTLLGTRRDVQNAIVIATIIGPCRALEPPSEETAPVSSRRAARQRPRQPAHEGTGTP